MDVKAFDDFRDNNPGWEKESPFEIALKFWKGGEEAAYQRTVNALNENE